MLRFSANIEMLGTHVDFYERFSLAKKSGFDAAEFWSFEGKDLARIATLSRELALPISSLSGDGPSFSLCDDSHRKGYVEYARRAMDAANLVGSPLIVLHSNALGEGGRVVDSYSESSVYRLYMNMALTLSLLAPYAEEAGITCVLEPLNIQVDHKGNLLHTIADTVEVVKAVGSPAVKVLYDFYHMQIESGNLLSVFAQNREHIGHIHIADNPGRHEPGTGEINYSRVVPGLERLGYEGVVAFELSPHSTYEKAVEAIMALKTFV
ncbi:MAG TPA: TIM barrel protein [Sphaerochaeta sp.]|nr:TIM barrel protein [Sphaerochaeta sp.]